MKTWSLCDPDTGLFTGAVVRCSDDQLTANSRSKHGPRSVLLPIEGRFDHRSQRVDLADPEKPRIVDHQPPRPSDDHEWIAQNPAGADRASQRWRWVKKPEAVQREMEEQRAKRAIADLDAADRLAAAGRLSAAERATLQRFRASAPSSGQAPTAPVEPPAE